MNMDWTQHETNVQRFERDFLAGIFLIFVNFKWNIFI
jgi:hypothetical protein